MDYKDLTALLVKLIGAVLLFWYVTWLPTLVPGALQAPSFWWAIFVNVVPSIVPLLLAVVLFSFPTTVANKLIGGDKLSTDAAFLVALEILSLRLIGVFYVFHSIVDLSTYFAKVLITPGLYEKLGSPAPPTAWTPDTAAWTLATFVELGLALWLVLGAHGIANAIQRLRGRDEES